MTKTIFYVIIIAIKFYFRGDIYVRKKKGYWCNGGGDESSEICITDALENIKSNVPAKLADAIYNSVAGYSKSEYEAASLTIEMIDACIKELNAESNKNNK